MKPEEFVNLTVRAYNQSKSVFANKINAEELVPKELSPLRKSQYIFYVLQLDYAMKSQILYRGAQELTKRIPDFFTPEYLSKTPEYAIKKLIQEYLHPRYINEALLRYRHNTEVLLDSYSGNPRSIFTSSTSCQEAQKRLKEFRGFGPKIGSFFIRTMINTFGYAYADIDGMLPPVDVHDVRIAYLLGYTKSPEMTAKNINLVKRVWRDACIKAGQSWLVFDKALWLLGSEGHPKNLSELVGLLTNSEQ